MRSSSKTECVKHLESNKIGSVNCPRNSQRRSQRRGDMFVPLYMNVKGNSFSCLGNEKELYVVKPMTELDSPKE